MSSIRPIFHCSHAVSRTLIPNLINESLFPELLAASVPLNFLKQLQYFFTCVLQNKCCKMVVMLKSAVAFKPFFPSLRHGAKCDPFNAFEAPVGSELVASYSIHRLSSV